MNNLAEPAKSCRTKYRRINSSLVPLCLVSIFGILLLSQLISHKYHGLAVQDSYDYAQLARNISTGEGYTTDLIIPVAIRHHPGKASTNSFPDFWRAPVFPLFISLWFLLLSPAEYTMLVAVSTCFIILLGFVYFVGQRLYSQKVGLLSAFLVASIPELQWYTIQCLREPLFTCLFSITAYIVHRRKNPWVIGLMLGICYLTRYNFAFFIPPFLIYLYIAGPAKDKVRKPLFLVKIVLALTFVIAPWALRNIALDKPPLFTLQHYELSLFTPEYPHYTIYRQVDTPDFWQYLRSRPEDVLYKTLHYSLLTYWPQAFHLPALTDANTGKLFSENDVPLSFPAFSPGDLLQVHSRRFCLFTILLLAMIAIVFSRRFYRNWRQKNFSIFAAIFVGVVLQFLLLLPIHPIIRHFIPFIPLLVVGAIGEWQSFCQRRLTRRIALSGVLLLGGIGIVSSFSTPAASAEFQLALAEEMSEIRNKTPEQALIATNIPFPLPWKAQRKAVWLPRTLEDWQKIEKSLGKIAYFYYHSSGGSDWQNTEQNFKLYLEKNFVCIYRSSHKGYHSLLFLRKDE